MMWGHATLAVCVLASAWCGPIPDEDDSWALGLKVAYGTYQQCEQQDDIFSCLKLRALRFMDRAIQKDSIPLLEGVTLVKTPDEKRSIPETLPSTDVVENALPSDAEDRHDRLNELLVERVRLFMTTHSLQLNMPRYMTESEEVPLDTFLEEGRDKKKKKKKKLGGILALAVLGKLLLLKGIGIKLVGLLAAKALLISKLALVLAVAALLLKVLSKAGAAAGGGGGGGGGDGGDKTTYEIIKVPYIAHADGGHDHGGGGGGYGGGGGGYGGGGGHYDSSGGGGGHHYDSSGGGGGGGYGGGWGRSVQGDAHMLAYRAHTSRDAHGTPSPKLI